MPSGGDGFYYFSVYLTTEGAESAYFDLGINGQPLCSVTGDLTTIDPTDEIATSCSGVAQVVEGKTLFLQIVPLNSVIKKN